MRISRNNVAGEGAARVDGLGVAGVRLGLKLSVVFDAHLFDQSELGLQEVYMAFLAF